MGLPLKPTTDTDVKVLLDFEDDNIGATTFTDLSSFNRTCIQNNSPATVSDNFSVFGTKSVFCAGGDIQIQASSGDFDAYNTTIEAFVYIPNLTGTWSSIFHKGGTPSGSTSLVFCTIADLLGNGVNTLFTRHRKGAGANYDVTSSPIPLVANTWHHVAFVYSNNGTYIKQYLDYILYGEGVVQLEDNVIWTNFETYPMSRDTYIDGLRLTQRALDSSEFLREKNLTQLVEPTCSYVGEVATSVANLDHLEGETVSIFANGEVLDQQTVNNGTVNLGENYSVVHVGLPYNSDLETLNVNFDSKLGSIQGSNVKIGNATFRLHDSRGGYIGPDSDNLYEAFTQQSFRESLGQNLTDIELFTGDVRQPLGSEYKKGGRIFYRQSDPLPVTIGAIVPEVAVGGPSR